MLVRTATIYFRFQGCFVLVCQVYGCPLLFLILVGSLPKPFRERAKGSHPDGTKAACCLPAMPLLRAVGMGFAEVLAGGVVAVLVHMNRRVVEGAWLLLVMEVPHWLGVEDLC